MGGGPQGFYKAPVTKGICVVTGLASIMGVLWQPGQKSLSLMQRLGPVPRSLFHTVAFSATAEAVVGLFLLYTFRQFERYMGSNKFGVLMLFSTVVSKSLCLAASYAFPNLLHSTSAGPYGPIFALLVFFHRYVPKIKPTVVNVCGLSVSDKTMTYLVSLQLALSGGWQSGVPALAGFASGLMFASDLLPFQKWRVPGFIARCCDSVFMPFLASGPPGEVARRRAAARHAAAGGDMPGMRRPGMTPGGDAAVPPGAAAMMQAALNNPALWQQMAARSEHMRPAVEVPPPSEDDIAAIEAMGFDRPAVVAALRATQNNRAMAINRLLTTG